MSNIKMNTIISPIEKPSTRISQIKNNLTLPSIDVIDSGPIISPIRIEKKSIKKPSHLSYNNVDSVTSYTKILPCIEKKSIRKLLPLSSSNGDSLTNLINSLHRSKKK